MNSYLKPIFWGILFLLVPRIGLSAEPPPRFCQSFSWLHEIRSSTPTRENELINEIFAEYGWGKTPQKPIDRYVLKKLRSKLTPLEIIFPFDKWAREAKSIFREEIDSLLEIHPILRENSELYASIKKEVFRHYVFNRLMARMTGAEVNPSANIVFAASNPIYDLLFDNPAYYQFKSWHDVNRVRSILAGEKPADATHGLEKVLIAIVSRLKETLPKQNQPRFFSELLKLHDAQVDSMLMRKDINGDAIETSFLRDNTFKRGGHAVRLNFLLADRKFSEAELESFFLLGSTLQNIDDMSDIKEDRSLGIRTLSSQNKISPHEVWEMGQLVRKRFAEHIKNHDYEARNVRIFMDSIDHFIIEGTDKYYAALRKGRVSATLGAEIKFFKKMKKEILHFAREMFPLFELF